MTTKQLDRQSYPKETWIGKSRAAKQQKESQAEGGQIQTACGTGLVVRPTIRCSAKSIGAKKSN
jgi:hypothetical protein